MLWIVIAVTCFSCKSRELAGTTGWSIEDAGIELLVEDHVIAIDSGYIEKKEVSVKQYKKFLYVIKDSYGLDSAKNHFPVYDSKEEGIYDQELDTYFPDCFSGAEANNLPITNVSFESAQSYCKWRGFYEFYELCIAEGAIKYTTSYLQFKEDQSPKIDEKIDWRCCGEFRKVRIYHGLFIAKYNLPTKNQWEQAAFQGLDSSEFQLGKIKTRWYGGIDSLDLGLNLNKNLKNVNEAGLHPNGCFGMTGNVSEMTIVKGISKGGNITIDVQDLDLRKEHTYSKPSSNLGFRCVMIYKRGPTCWE